MEAILEDKQPIVKESWIEPIMEPYKMTSFITTSTNQFVDEYQELPGSMK